MKLQIHLEMPTGTVARFFVRKGFGFIKPDDSEEEIFVHHSALGGNGFKTLADGEAVEYEVDGNASRSMENPRWETSCYQRHRTRRSRSARCPEGRPEVQRRQG